MLRILIPANCRICFAHLLPRTVALSTKRVTNKSVMSAESRFEAHAKTAQHGDESFWRIVERSNNTFRLRKVLFDGGRIEDMYMPWAQCPTAVVRHKSDRDEYVVGDIVVASNAENSDSKLLEGRMKRSSILRRPETESGKKSSWSHKKNMKDLAANVDQAVIVVAPSPPSSLESIDRLLAACVLSGLRPVIAVNKCDLRCEAAALLNDLQYYQKRLSVPLIPVTALPGELITAATTSSSSSSRSSNSSISALDGLLVELRGRSSIFIVTIVLMMNHTHSRARQNDRYRDGKMDPLLTSLCTAQCSASSSL